MKTPRNVLAAFALTACLASPAFAQKSDVDVAVIVNVHNPLTSISMSDLYKVFSGEKQSWSASMPVFVVVRAPQARERDVLLNRLLKMSESEYKQYWVKKVYSGSVPREPLAVFSNGIELEAVRTELGGIALISSRDVHDGVKVLKINGREPGTPGYPLR